jgi:hypothetical protein
MEKATTWRQGLRSSTSAIRVKSAARDPSVTTNIGAARAVGHRSTRPTSGYETEGHRFESCRARLSRRGSCLQTGHRHLQDPVARGGTEITLSDIRAW